MNIKTHSHDSNMCLDMCLDIFIRLFIVRLQDTRSLLSASFLGLFCMFLFVGLFCRHMEQVCCSP